MPIGTRSAPIGMLLAAALAVVSAAALVSPAAAQGPPVPAAAVPAVPPVPPGGGPAQPGTAPAPKGTSGPPVPVDVGGADRITYDAATQEYTFLGAHVVVTRGTQRLEAREIHYDSAHRRAVLPRGGTITTPTMNLDADAITAELSTRHVLADGHVHGRFLDQGVWGTVTAARVEADDRPELRRVDASGDAVIVRGDEELRGNHVVYDRTTQQGTVDGHAVAVRGGDRIEADHIQGNLGTHEGVATGHVVLDRAATHVHGTADRATYSGAAGTVVLTGHAVVTRNRDQMEADQITVHLQDNRAVADGHPKIVAYPSTTSP